MIPFHGNIMNIFAFYFFHLFHLYSIVIKTEIDPHFNLAMSQFYFSVVSMTIWKKIKICVD